MSNKWEPLEIGKYVRMHLICITSNRTHAEILIDKHIIEDESLTFTINKSDCQNLIKKLQEIEKELK